MSLTPKKGKVKEFLICQDQCEFLPRFSGKKIFLELFGKPIATSQPIVIMGASKQATHNGDETMTNSEPIRVHTDPKPTKKFPTLQRRVRTYRTSEATRYGFIRYAKDWSIDGQNWFRSAKEAKKSQDS